MSLADVGKQEPGNWERAQLEAQLEALESWAAKRSDRCVCAFAGSHQWHRDFELV